MEVGKQAASRQRKQDDDAALQGRTGRTRARHGDEMLSLSVSLVWCGQCGGQNDEGVPDRPPRRHVYMPAHRTLHWPETDTYGHTDWNGSTNR
nr:unnamed protein product [Digitaria exilis]